MHWRMFFGSLLVLSSLACESSTGPDTPNITGEWNLTFSYGNSFLGIGCQINGARIALTQNASNFSGSVISGSGTCSAGGSSQQTNVTGTVLSGGQLDGSSVSFASLGGLTFRGLLSGRPANRMEGTVSGSLSVSGIDYPVSGPWVAIR